MVRSLVPGVSFPHEVKQPLQVVGVGLAVEQRALSPTLPHFGSHSAQTETRRSLIFTKNDESKQSAKSAFRNCHFTAYFEDKAKYTHYEIQGYEKYGSVLK